MAVGAQDYIDQMLAKKYASEKVNNTEDSSRLNMSQDRYWELQKDIADVQRALVMVGINIKKKVPSVKTAGVA